MQVLNTTETAVKTTENTEPKNPLEKAKEDILQWIYSTGTEDQKKMILVELNERIRKWERAMNYAQSRAEYARKVLERVTSEVPF